MSPLERFFDGQARFFASAGRPLDAARALLAEHPGWAPGTERVALYADFALSHVRTLLEQLYPTTRCALPPATWALLVEHYYDLRPARAGYEINATGVRFPDCVEARLADLDLPAFLPALARLEWALHAVHSTPVEVPEVVLRLTINPTLDVLEHGWRLCAVLDGAPDPCQEPERALLWRHPGELRARFMPAGPRTLLALKMAAEGLEPASVALEGGVAEDEVLRVIAEHVRHGVLLAPA